MRNNAVKIGSILGAFFLSVLFIWIVGSVFCDSLRPYTYNEELEKIIYVPHTIYKQRSEGYAETFHGMYGINAIRDITKDQRAKYVVWGDSYIEAHQVNDSEKIPQLITEKLSMGRLSGESMCYGVGMSGDSVADYYFDIPKYERLTKDILSHYIVITSIEDTLPDQSTDTRKGIFRSEPLRLYEDHWRPKIPEVKALFARMSLNFAWPTFMSARSSFTKLSFLPGCKEKTVREQDTVVGDRSSDKMVEAWGFLFEELLKQTDRPVNFVYCPTVPTIDSGKIIEDDRQEKEMSLFIETASKYGIPVLDARPNFVAFHKRTGLFPRGFLNSRPTGGHLNKYGHEIVADLIASHIMTGKPR